jgi:hypothetical protein
MCLKAPEDGRALVRLVFLRARDREDIEVMIGISSMHFDDLSA